MFVIPPAMDTPEHTEVVDLNYYPWTTANPTNTQTAIGALLTRYGIGCGRPVASSSHESGPKRAVNVDPLHSKRKVVQPHQICGICLSVLETSTLYQQTKESLLSGGT
jgi:hypothetical protein